MNYICHKLIQLNTTAMSLAYCYWNILKHTSFSQLGVCTLGEHWENFWSGLPYDKHEGESVTIYGSIFRVLCKLSSYFPRECNESYLNILASYECVRQNNDRLLLKISKQTFLQKVIKYIIEAYFISLRENPLNISSCYMNSRALQSPCCTRLTQVPY